MGVPPRAGLAIGLAGLFLGAGGTAAAQAPPAQASPQAGYSMPNPPWRPASAPGTTAPGGPGSPQGPSDAAPPPPGTATPSGATPGTPGSPAAPGTGTGTGTGAATSPGDGAGAAPNPGAALPAAGTTGAADAALSSGLGGGLGAAPSYFNMVGDVAPIARTFAVPSPPGLPTPGVPPTPPGVQRLGNARAVAVLPSIRGFKIAENQSPAPQDRFYYSFNYYDNLNGQVNARLNSPLSQLKAYRHIFGLEKTFLDGRASVGLRLPIDSLTATSTTPAFGGTHRAAGDLAAIFKYALINDRDAGRIFSIGLLTSMPTGPRSFAGTPGIRSPHNAALQPFVGFVQQYGDFYVQGFSAVDVPTNPNDVTMFYNDLGAGYYVYRATDPDRFLSAFAPTAEVHVNTPLNHRDPYNLRDLAGSYDVVDLTFGTNFQIRRRGLLTLAIVEPVTGPRPFSIETIVQFNLRF